MKKLKGLGSFVAASVLTVTALLNIALVPTASAAADTCLWTGGGAADNFNDALNWTNCDNGGLPEAGDTLEFGTLSGNPVVNVTNDLGLAFAGLNLTAANGGSTTYIINTLTVQNNGVLNDQGEGSGGYTNLTINSLIAQNNITITGDDTRLLVGSATINGVLTLAGGAYFDADKVGSSGVIVQNGSVLSFTASSTTATAPSFPITLGGGSGTDRPVLEFWPDQSGATTFSFPNAVTLLGNAYILLAQPLLTVNQTGAITGPGFAIALDPESSTGSTLVLAPTGNSATVAGTYTGTGGGVGVSGSTGPEEDAPAAPDTGFALAAKNPAVTAAIVLAAAIVIALIARRLQVASVKSRK